MKKNIKLGLTAGLLVVLISSCSLTGTSMASRVDLFILDLNGTRSGIMDNIHPDAPGYNTANGSDYWNQGIWDPINKTFSISNIVESSGSISADFVYGGNPVTITLEMKNDGTLLGEDWKIWSCTVDGTQQF